VDKRERVLTERRYLRRIADRPPSTRYAWLVVVNVIGMTLALTLFSFGLSSYRRTVEYREQWQTGAT